MRALVWSRASAVMRTSVGDDETRAVMDERFPERFRQLSQPRVAEMVADILRARIVDGDLADGDLLPKQDDLLDEFRVSRPSIREAMRILETEGLISVRRGNIGGAEVHAPKADSAAHMLGLVMQSHRVALSDLAESLCILEPDCAALCADRPDRAAAVVPRLRELCRQAEERFDDCPEFTRLSRQFHDEIALLCGNTTMILLVGTLETLWASHEAQWTDSYTAEGDHPEARRRRMVLRAHVRLTDAIEAGNRELTYRLARRHLGESQRYVLASGGRQRVNITGVGSHLGRTPLRVVNGSRA
jgi:GntR family transcriptional regulator, transcriptional repressor for pyruvate dehydrogenase complex